MPILDHTFAVLDTETTGADPQKDIPIEIAVCKIEKGIIQPPKSWLIDPKFLIPPESSAIHHLTDEDVAGMPTIDQVMPEVLAFVKDCYIVAHNAPFDRSMLKALQNAPWICTLRLARHIWPKGQKNMLGQPLVNHQQQTIRYWRKLKIDTMGLAAHRAAADILVTAQIFKELIQEYIQLGGDDDLEALIDLMNSPITIKNMPFGQHFEKPLSIVPTEYLEYLIKNDQSKPLDPDLKASICYELERRKAEIIIVNRVQENA